MDLVPQTVSGQFSARNTHPDKFATESFYFCNSFPVFSRVLINVRILYKKYIINNNTTLGLFAT